MKKIVSGIGMGIALSMIWVIAVILLPYDFFMVIWLGKAANFSQAVFSASEEALRDSFGLFDLDLEWWHLSRPIQMQLQGSIWGAYFGVFLYFLVWIL